MTNAAADLDAYLDSIPYEWLFCRGYGHDLKKPSKRVPKHYVETFDHAEANIECRIYCLNGCGYHFSYLAYLHKDGETITHLEPESRYDNPEYNVRGFRVSREEARSYLIRRDGVKVRAKRADGSGRGSATTKRHAVQA